LKRSQVAQMEIQRQIKLWSESTFGLRHEHLRSPRLA
jgi:hypothetical protein